MNRRGVLASIGGFAISTPLAASAQTAPAVRRIGFLSSESPSNQGKRLEALRMGLRGLGYREGSNIIIEERWAEGDYARLPELARQLAELQVSVVVTSGTKATLAMRDAHTSVPIVMGSTGDPVGLGLTTSLAHPSGTVTGSSSLNADLFGKRLELLKEAVPRLARVAYLVNTANSPSAFPALRSEAASLKVDLGLVEIPAPKAIDRAIADLAHRRVEAIVVQGDTMFSVNARTVAELAAMHHLPSAGTAEYAQAGGMLGFGADPLEGHRRAAIYVDRILKGAKPGDLPIERAMKFQLVLNRKTARTLGIAMPQSLLLRADEVIE
ncbi:MAG TPA: ABC transporter substrate-binding protein [Burkholderiaceae bacterium]|nr:ABC transporter substrate-binding protein [Burkholderiaceae bacterium]